MTKQIYAVIGGEVAPDLDGVYGVSAAGLTAVVGDSEVEDYRLLPQEELLKHLVQHQQVVEQLMADYAVLPIQFGSLLREDEQIGRMLGANQQRFSDLLDELQGLVQMELVVLWESAAVFNEIAAELDIPRINASLVGKTEGEIQAKQAEIGLKVQQSLAERQGVLERMLRDETAGFARGVIKNPQMDENMAVNLGVLLAEGDLPLLDSALESMDEKTDGRYLLRCVGPLPPHSFVKISVLAPQPQVIHEARIRLGLGTEATQKEIQQAYHARSQQVH
ncbi:MAG: GvpL/GvpF family gas vesicle protein, partial [Sphaerospermopsis sp. SIO1G2]|nr:GvpL/GvpF family gas vesicle protein [Sphaerospermopsis sp. SIO1G2]